MEEPLEVQIAELLNSKGWKLSVAESCTGGYLGHIITNVAGSSEYFIGGVTAYSYEAKEKILGVRHETLETFGAVSAETVIEMAHGVRELLNTEVSLSISGIAGPGGGMPNKPVGLVWIGLSSPEGDFAFENQWNGNREENKIYSAEAALQILINYLSKEFNGSR